MATTADIAALKRRACEAVDRWAGELIETADWIHAHPELGHQEIEASRRLADILATNGDFIGAAVQNFLQSMKQMSFERHSGVRVEPGDLADAGHVFHQGKTFTSAMPPRK